MTFLALLTALTSTSAQKCVQGDGLFNVPNRGKVVLKEERIYTPKFFSDPNYEVSRKGKNAFFRQDSYVYLGALSTDVTVCVVCGNQPWVYYSCYQGGTRKWPNYNCLASMKLVASVVRGPWCMLVDSNEVVGDEERFDIL